MPNARGQNSNPTLPTLNVRKPIITDMATRHDAARSERELMDFLLRSSYGRTPLPTVIRNRTRTRTRTRTPVIPSTSYRRPANDVHARRRQRGARLPRPRSDEERRTENDARRTTHDARERGQGEGEWYRYGARERGDKKRIVEARASMTKCQCDGAGGGGGQSYNIVYVRTDDYLLRDYGATASG